MTQGRCGAPFLWRAPHMHPEASASSAREHPCRAPRLPAGVAAHCEDARWHRDRVGEAGAAVYRVARPGRADLYLKHGRGAVAEAVVDEMVRLRWLQGHLPVARLLHFEVAASEAWLLTHALPGRTAYQWLCDAPAHMPQIVTTLARTLAQLHRVPVPSCPFQAPLDQRLAHARQRLDAGLIDPDDFDDARQGWTPAQVWRELQRLRPTGHDAVVCHGDYSLDNLLLDAQGRLTGLIDLGRLGVADRFQDLAILWNSLGEFGTDAQRHLFSAYGLAPPDARRLDFYLCLDECF